jgi:hypothetical protein
MARPRRADRRGDRGHRTMSALEGRAVIPWSQRSGTPDRPCRYCHNSTRCLPVIGAITTGRIRMRILLLFHLHEYTRYLREG